MAKLRILLVDDENELVDALAERLDLRGFYADGVTSGAEALARVRAEGYDVVVLDVKMPGESGIEIMKSIKKEKPDLPVILITGHGSAQDGEQGLNEGAFDYLQKPIQLETLIKKINEAAASSLRNTDA